MDKSFSSLKTEQFRVKMRPYAINIYNSIWNNCTIDDLRENGVNVHILDKEFGIDTIANFNSGQWISIQEKYRKYRFYNTSYLQLSPPIPDFTQEYKNAEGTEYENNGEWFKLGAQLYFYGWANQDESDFIAWFLMDIPRYKMIIENNGGLQNIGKKMQNNFHGKASFYAIPCNKLKKAFLKCSDSLKNLIINNEYSLN